MKRLFVEQVSKSKLRLNRWRNWDVNFKEQPWFSKIFGDIINQLNDKALVQNGASRGTVPGTIRCLHEANAQAYTRFWH